MEFGQDNKAPELTLEKFQKIRDLIYEVSAIYFPDNKKYLLENRLFNRLKSHKLKSYDEYYYFLKYDPLRSKELKALFDAVTTNETSFFRYPIQIEAFKNTVFPEILAYHKKNNQKRLRLWSAGCATGEEPYTLSMIIMEALKEQTKGWDIDVLASDISQTALISAGKGLYNEYSMRNTSQLYKDKYFTKNGSNFRLNEQVKKLVTLKYLNLADDKNMKTIREQDIIFCRNVIIYFEDDSKKKVISHFYDSLRPGGYLFIGHSESLHNITRAFKLIHFKGALAYKKE